MAERTKKMLRLDVVREMARMQIGTVVQLNSGGPWMTVQHVNEVEGDDDFPAYVEADCVWFPEGAVEIASVTFDAACLRVVSDAERHAQLGNAEP